MKRFAITLALFTALALILAATAPSGTSAQSSSDGPQYEVQASGARLVREVTGEVTNEVEGIPAEPVHSFVWDGEAVTNIEGTATVEINPVNNTGEIKAEWTDPEGNEWTLSQTAFSPPPHPTGFQAGSSILDRLIEGDPVTTNVYLHGDTTAGGPVLPTIFNFIATWGPAEVKLNGQPFENPFDGPAPLWMTHTMLTAGVRDSDGQVKVSDGSLYDPSKQSQAGVVDDGDVEFHIVFHDAPGPEMTANFPPPLDFFYHVQFEAVKLEIEATD